MTNVLFQSQTKTVDIFEHSDVGLFEINDEGTVLYFRTATEKPSSEKSVAAVGRNFFYEIAPFENMEELRRRFKGFIQSRASTENFSFNCRIKNENIPAKILLVRIIERSDSVSADSTIVDIRKI